ncbi:MAG TPA: EAL domain-containing protein [Dongiaceae bacterium]|nr:EAL domain-containing protein [Dongiaceae bacterium]
MKLGIGIKLGLLLSIFSVLAAGFTGYYSFSESRTLLVKAAEQELLTSTQVIGRSFTQMLNESADNVRLLASLPAARAVFRPVRGFTNRAEAEDVLANIFNSSLALHPEYFQIRLIEANNHGLERVRVDRNSDGLHRVASDDMQEKAHYPYVYQTLRLPPGAVFISRIFINHETGIHLGVNKPTLQVATAVLDEQGTKLGLVVINIDLNGLFYLLQTDLPGDMNLYLTNNEGDFLIHPNASKAFGFDRGQRMQIQTLYPHAAALINGERESMVFRLHEYHDSKPLERNQAAALIRLSFGELAPERFVLLGLSRPLPAIFAGTDELGRTIIQIIIAFSLCAVVLSALITRAVAQPLQMMVRAVQRFSKGHVMGELPVRSTDEIGLLARAFSDMEGMLREHLDSLHEKEVHLHHIAQHDHLTNLPNRLLLFDRLQQVIVKSHRSPQPVAVIFIDLDRFKDINDSLGHAVGDELIRQVSRRLRSLVRDEDTVARLGGDEFIVVLEQIQDPGAVVMVAQKLLAQLQNPLRVGERDLYVTASLGISLFPQDGSDPETLVRNADAAMYRSKAEGRNSFHFYTEDMTEQALSRVQLETELRQALEQNQFRLHYQPQVDLQSGAIVGLEALVRWQHPHLNLLGPNHFIPLAEDTGLIEPIGAWVLREACSQMKRWRDAGLNPGRVAVNLSGKQLRRKELVAGVLQVLDETGCEAAWLELEVTESMFMERAGEAAASLQAFRTLGVELAIDDFGTGYSSLSYLKHLPVSKLKIDRSFTLNVPDAPDDKAITRAIIALASSLGLKTLAEGVETEAQRAFLQAEGCCEMQGYLFSRPLPPSDLERLLRDHASRTHNLS